MWGVLVAAGMSLFQWAWPRVLALFGVATISATVYTPLLTWLQGKVQQNLQGMSGDVLSFLQFVGVPDAINIIFAAMTLKVGLRAAKVAFQTKVNTSA